MTRVLLTAEEAAFVRKQIGRLTATDANPHIRAEVLANGALPLYLGWVEAIGLRADGELVRWVTQDWRGVPELNDATWVTLGLVSGAHQYPPLQRLLPTRPSSARICAACGGQAPVLLRARGVFCECGGTGWVVDA
jgi:hypothetical protein